MQLKNTGRKAAVDTKKRQVIATQKVHLYEALCDELRVLLCSCLENVLGMARLDKLILRMWPSLLA
jgi:hypothetical protein